MVEKASLRNWIDWDDPPASFQETLEYVQETDSVDSYEIGGLYAHYDSTPETEQIHISTYLPDEEIFEDRPFQPILFLHDRNESGRIMLTMDRIEYLGEGEDKTVAMDKDLYDSLLEDAKEEGMFEILDGEDYDEFLEEVRDRQDS